MSRGRAAENLAKVGGNLGLTMRFTDPAVIAENRHGRLTPQQIDLIARTMHPTERGCGLIMVPGFFLLLLGVTYIALARHGQLSASPRPYISALVLAVLIVVGVLINVHAGKSRARAQGRLAGGKVPRIDHAEGEIAWSQKKKCYCLHVPGHALAFPAFVGDLFRISLISYLRPGPYRFYYVNDPEKPGEIMVSAEPTGGDELARLAVQQGLCAALGFTTADLTANQRGLLSDRQIKALPRVISQRGNFAVRQLTGDIRVRFVHVPGEEGPGSNAYFYELGGLRFEVAGEGPAALAGSGLRYHVYYLDGTDILLSIEPLPFKR